VLEFVDGEDRANENAGLKRFDEGIIEAIRLLMVRNRCYQCAREFNFEKMALAKSVFWRRCILSLSLSLSLVLPC
jgi:hypothetical protein